MIEKGITSVNEDENSDLEIELVSTEKRGKNISHVNFRFISESFKSIKKATPQQLNYLNKKTAKETPKTKSTEPPEFSFKRDFKPDTNNNISIETEKNKFLKKAKINRKK
jgi:hypothetical protein